ncbi:hypothetical protein [Capnocytophaga granulosa]|uniref:hypothetical protein n=1 Tax=Capnocytophaga granulosa TaxID=45242 RepID=UPI0036117E68
MTPLYAQCIPYNENIKGRIGGNPPINIETEIPEGYAFYATLVHPEKEDKMLSILISNDFNQLIHHQSYPNILIKVVEHNFSYEGDKYNLSLPQIGKTSSISHYSRNKQKFNLVQVGGRPDFIDDDPVYYEKLLADDYSFYLSIDEEGYDVPSMKMVIFSYGAVYLYKHNKTGEIIAGFWQYT